LYRGVYVPLSSGFLHPLTGFSIILRHALALGIQLAEVVLRFCLPLLGQRSPFTKGSCVVSTVIGIHASFKIGPGGSNETDDREHQSGDERERHEEPRREAYCRREANEGARGAR